MITDKHCDDDIVLVIEGPTEALTAAVCEFGFIVITCDDPLTLPVKIRVTAADPMIGLNPWRVVGPATRDDWEREIEFLEMNFKVARNIPRLWFYKVATD